jgi:nicotinamidase-related amidase
VTLTTLDPTTALIVVDLQKGVAGAQAGQVIDGVVARAAELAAAFRAHELPVVLVNVVGGAPGRIEQPRRGGGFPPDFGELVPQLDLQPTDVLVTKRTWGAFTGTSLAGELRARGVTQVVIVGVATSIGVESTARQAHELGFHVTLAIDAMTDRLPENHEHSVRAIFPRLGETGSTAEVLALLQSTRA